MGAVNAGRAERAFLQRWTTTRAVLLAFVAVVVSFLASNAYTEVQAAKIDAAAMSIAENAAPSVKHLAATRAEIRGLQALVGDYVNDAVLGHPGDPGRIAEARAELSRDIEAYLMLPVYSDERELWQKVSAELADLDRLADRVLSLVSSDHATEANDLDDHALRAAFNRTSDAVTASIDFNAQQTQRLARTIEEQRDRTRGIVLVLDALSAMLAVVAGGVAIAFVRRHETLLREHALLVERRADELDKFAARVAHDVSGPLGTVMLSNQLVAGKLDGDPAAQKTLARGERAALRVRRIVDGLLDFARAGAVPELGVRAEVGPVIDDLALELGPAAETAAAELRVEPFAPCVVAASPGVLTSLVANLARNALKHLGDAPVRCVVLRVLDAGGAVRVEVEDTGPGVPPTLEPLVFQPYVRGPGTSDSGLGLGLATVKSLAEAHGGHVGLRSVVGKGSTFWFDLPKAAPAPSALPPLAAARAS
jgi:signal transduction histidine kinase